MAMPERDGQGRHRSVVGQSDRGMRSSLTREGAIVNFAGELVELRTLWLQDNERAHNDGWNP